MILGSMLLQIIIIAGVSYGPLGMKPFLVEAMKIMTLTKSLDASAGVYNKTGNSGKVFDPGNELMGIRFIKMAIENIPSSCLQFYAFLVSEDKSYGRLLCLIANVGVVAFISSTISYDTDTNVDLREQSPLTYGFVPSAGVKRTKVFVAMCCLSFCHVVLKVIGTVFLVVVSPALFGMVLAADIVLYIIGKSIRGDILYWIPVYGISGYLLSYLIRIGVKFINDFTSLVHFRHPYEVSILV